MNSKDKVLELITEQREKIYDCSSPKTTQVAIFELIAESLKQQDKTNQLLEQQNKTLTKQNTILSSIWKYT